MQMPFERSAQPAFAVRLAPSEGTDSVRFPISLYACHARALHTSSRFLSRAPKEKYFLREENYFLPKENETKVKGCEAMARGMKNEDVSVRKKVNKVNMEILCLS